jgi:hypothetical protein
LNYQYTRLEDLPMLDSQNDIKKNMEILFATGCRQES